MDIAGLAEALLRLLRLPMAFSLQTACLAAIVFFIARLPWTNERERTLAILAALSAWFDGTNGVIQIANEAASTAFEDETLRRLAEIKGMLKSP